MVEVSEELLPHYGEGHKTHDSCCKTCISECVYGDYENLLNLFQHELKMHKIFLNLKASVANCLIVSVFHFV